MINGVRVPAASSCLPRLKPGTVLLREDQGERLTFTRVQEPHGHDSGPVAESAGGIQRRSLRNAPVFTERKLVKAGRLLEFRQQH